MNRAKKEAKKEKNPLFPDGERCFWNLYQLNQLLDASLVTPDYGVFMAGPSFRSAKHSWVARENYEAYLDYLKPGAVPWTQVMNGVGLEDMFETSNCCGFDGDELLLALMNTYESAPYNEWSPFLISAICTIYTFGTCSEEYFTSFTSPHPLSVLEHAYQICEHSSLRYAPAMKFITGAYKVARRRVPKYW